jgi:hypothetical protein
MLQDKTRRLHLPSPLLIEIKKMEEKLRAAACPALI